MLSIPIRIREVLRPAAFVALLLWLPTQAASQSTAAADARAYLALVGQYQDGHMEDAAAALGEHDERWVASALGVVERSVRTWAPRRAQSAIMLHTDAVVDGWANPRRVPMHLDAARRLAVAAGSEIVPSAFVHDWLLVVTWYLHSELDLASMPPWLDLLLGRWRDDPDVQLTVGAYFEALGWTDDIPTQLPWQSQVLRSLRDRTRRGVLEGATEALRRALVLAPGSDQARVRLGRTLVELGKSAEAIPLLAPVRDGSGEVEWRYLANLVTASAEVERERIAAAADAYERASALMPACQTPLLGLAALRRLQGRALDAAAIAERLAADEGRCDDPWWTYRFGQTPERRARLLLDLRRRATSP